MDLAAPGREPIISANLESTRVLKGQGPQNLMPVEYVGRFVEHSRVNAMHLVYGFTQNAEKGALWNQDQLPGRDPKPRQAADAPARIVRTTERAHDRCGHGRVLSFRRMGPNYG